MPRISMNGAGSEQFVNEPPQKPQNAPIDRCFVLAGSGPLSWPGPLVPAPVQPVVSPPGGVVRLPFAGPVLRPYAGGSFASGVGRSSRVQSVTRAIEIADFGPVEGISSATPAPPFCGSIVPAFVRKSNLPCVSVEHVSVFWTLPALS